jgi:hypothetical protein
VPVSVPVSEPPLPCRRNDDTSEAEGAADRTLLVLLLDDDDDDECSLGAGGGAVAGSASEVAVGAGAARSEADAEAEVANEVARPKSPILTRSECASMKILPGFRSR